jgi:hypothetical protein
MRLGRMADGEQTRPCASTVRISIQPDEGATSDPAIQISS